MVSFLNPPPQKKRLLWVHNVLSKKKERKRRRKLPNPFMSLQTTFLSSDAAGWILLPVAWFSAIVFWITKAKDNNKIQYHLRQIISRLKTNLMAFLSEKHRKEFLEGRAGRLSERSGCSLTISGTTDVVLANVFFQSPKIRDAPNKVQVFLFPHPAKKAHLYHQSRLILNLASVRYLQDGENGQANYGWRVMQARSSSST